MACNNGSASASAGSATAKTELKNQQIENIPLTVRETQIAAVQDLQTVLRLIGKGKFAISDKTFRPSSASAEALSVLLCGGDFYEIVSKKISGIKKSDR